MLRSSTSLLALSPNTNKTVTLIWTSPCETMGGGGGGCKMEEEEDKDGDGGKESRGMREGGKVDGEGRE